MSDSGSRKRSQQSVINYGKLPVCKTFPSGGTFVSINNFNCCPGCGPNSPSSSPNSITSNKQPIKKNAGRMQITNSDGSEVTMGPEGMKSTNACGSKIDTTADSSMRDKESDGKLVNMNTGFPIYTQSTTYDTAHDSSQQQSSTGYVFGNMTVGSIYVNGKKLDLKPGAYNISDVIEQAFSTLQDISCQNDDCDPTPQKRAKTEAKPAPTESKTKDDKELPVLDGEECLICFRPYRRVEDMKFLPCNHYFHRGCIRYMQKTDSTCPVCTLSAVTGEKV